MKRFTLSALALGLFTSAGHAQSWFQGMGFLPGATINESYPYDISGDGTTAVAYAIDSNGAGQPVKWTKAQGLVSLGEIPGAWSLTANGEAIGVSHDGSVITGSSPGLTGREVFRWTEATGMVGLGDLVTLPISQAYGRALSDDGSVIVGMGDYSYGLPGPLYGESFRWTQATGLVGLGHLNAAPNQQYGTAVACSANGSVIVGWATTPNGYEGYRWTQATGMVPLGDLPGGAFDSGAVSCSANGNIIVGWVSVEGRYEPGMWKQSTGWVSLGVGNSTSTENYAADCTPDGSVVVGLLDVIYGGPFNYEQYGESFTWDATNGLRDVKEELLLQGVTSVKGWILYGAHAVADDGKTITGGGINPQGEYEGWVCYLDDAPCSADCDGSGTLDFFDFLCFQNNFAAGCP